MWLLIVLFNGTIGVNIADLNVVPTKMECERKARLTNKADSFKAFCVEYPVETQCNNEECIKKK